MKIEQQNSHNRTKMNENNKGKSLPTNWIIFQATKGEIVTCFSVGIRNRGPNIFGVWCRSLENNIQEESKLTSFHTFPCAKRG